MDPEERARIVRELDALHDRAMKSRTNCNKVANALAAKTKDLISKYYETEVSQLSAEGYRELCDKIDRKCGSLAVEIDNIMSRHHMGD